MPGFPNSTSVTVTDVMATIDPAVGNVAKKYVWLVNIATGVKFGPSAATDSSGNWSLAAVDQGIYETFYAGESPVGVVPTQWTTAGVKGYLVSIASNPASLKSNFKIFNPITDYGAKGDVQIITDGAMATGSAVLTSASNKFTGADASKLITVPLAGAGGIPLRTTIASVQGAGSVTLAAANASGGNVTSSPVTWCSDDGAALRGMIADAQTAYGEIWIPPLPGGFGYSGTLAISGNLKMHGSGARTLWGTLVGGGRNPINLPQIAPYLAGSVLVPMDLNTDGLQITGRGTGVDLSDFGIRFGALYNSTGHGFHCLPPFDAPTHYDQGLTDSHWKNLKVYGHDGNHYGYRFMCSIYNTFDHLHSWCGGGLSYEQDTTLDTFGNDQFNHSIMFVAIGGTAHAYNFLGAWDLVTFIRPQAFVLSMVGDGGSNLPGTVPPTNAQYTWKSDNLSTRINLVGPDTEGNVASPQNTGNVNVFQIGGFGTSLGGVSTAGGEISGSGQSAHILIGTGLAPGTSMWPVYSAAGQPKMMDLLAGTPGGLYAIRSSQAVTLAGGTVNIDPSVGELVLAALNASTTLTFTAGALGQEMTIRFKHDASATAYTITWPATAKRAGGAFANTNTANAVDDITLAFDGTNWNEKSRAINCS